jgi:hypothetical protein
LLGGGLQTHAPPTLRRGYNPSVDTAKLRINPRYVVDEHGENREVLLSIEDYRALLELVEDYLDARTLAEAVRTETQFRPFAEVVADMRRDGVL